MKTSTALLLALAAAVTMAGCATTDTPASDGPAADAPTFRIGDKWVYRATDGFRVAAAWTETHEVVSIAPDAITLRVTEEGPSARAPRTEVWASPGQMVSGAVFDNETRKFTPPITIYDFPIVPGHRWGGWSKNFNETTQKAGQISRNVTVGGWTKVDTPAGSFDALSMRVLMVLDDREFWRGPTNANYLIHYAPSVGAMVRAEKNAFYISSSGALGGAVTSQRAVLELVSYTRGAP